MPYQSWEMLPLGPNHTRLNIAGGKVEVSIDIKVIYRVCVCVCVCVRACTGADPGGVRWARTNPPYCPTL